MTDVEKMIFTQVYSWHMASYQKRYADHHEFLEYNKLLKRSEDAIQEASDVVEAFRATQNEWFTTETSMMLKGLLGESDPPKPTVGKSQQVPDGMGVVLTAGEK